jgi:AmmeMemoRadiSam system protein B
VREAEAKFSGKTVYVAGVDFSHVGPRFGDGKLTDELKEEVAKLDAAALDAAVNGDAERWFQTIASVDDATRICGFAPTYCMLRTAEPGMGRALGYVQSAERDTSIVSVAAVTWP